MAKGKGPARKEFIGMKLEEVEALYDGHAEALYRYLFSLSMNPCEARDLLQELFVKVLRPSKGVRRAANPRAFLLRMARNLWIDNRRRNAAYRRAVNGYRSEQDRELFEASNDPDTQAFRKALSAALAQLPEEQREAVYLNLWEGMTFAEVAEQQAASVNTVISRYRYGIEKLQALLGPVYQELCHSER